MPFRVRLFVCVLFGAVRPPVVVCLDGYISAPVFFFALAACLRRVVDYVFGLVGCQ